MWITFESIENERNILERELPFELVADLDWKRAQAVEDTRRDYGERRLRVAAKLGNPLHTAAVTRRGDTIHVISFRKANRKETERYEQQEP